MRESVEVAITGAAGQVGYALIPEVLREQGGVFGERTVNLRLLEVPAVMSKLAGIAMEADDLASPIKGSVNISSDPHQAFDGVDFAFLVGSRPRKPGMERAELLEINAPIFVEQGRALNDVASERVRVLAVGNPANSNALVALRNAPDIPVERFSAMSRLDHNRAVGMLATKLGVGVQDIEDLIIWGNHSDKMVVDVSQVRLREGGTPSRLSYERAWIDELQSTVAHRGAEVANARKDSSAISAAHAAADQARDWVNGSSGSHSMAVYSGGEYQTPEGVVFSFPVVTQTDGNFRIVDGLELPDYVKDGLVASGTELEEERAALQQIGVL